MFVIKKILILLSICFGFSILSYAAKPGDVGEETRLIQQALIEKGYFDGVTDGIYGSSTEAAVKKYQQAVGLTADGLAGSATKKSLGITITESGASSSREEDLQLLARIISAEARGEPYEGQVAVGAVVLNRVAHPSFPNTLTGVIYQKHAFTAVQDGQFDEPIADSAYRAAEDAMNGWDPSGGAIYYYNPAKSTSEWIFTREVITVIGKHSFAI